MGNPPSDQALVSPFVLSALRSGVSGVFFRSEFSTVLPLAPGAQKYFNTPPHFFFLLSTRLFQLPKKVHTQSVQNFQK
jgi:hypothetical protein